MNDKARHACALSSNFSWIASIKGPMMIKAHLRKTIYVIFFRMHPIHFPYNTSLFEVLILSLVVDYYYESFPCAIGTCNAIYLLLWFKSFANMDIENEYKQHIYERRKCDSAECLHDIFIQTNTRIAGRYLS